MSESNINNYCIIMAGGVGSRFWPMSRAVHPKQFIDILGTGKSLIRQTYERFLKICPPQNIYVVTHESYVNLVSTQIPELSASQILSEPQRRNTAPCIAYAAYKIAQLNPKANLIIAPSDHIITKENVFSDVMHRSLRFTAKNDSFLTLGITPSRPDTGYGYIQFVEEKSNEESKVCKVKTFTEKPNLEMAKFFLRSGEFLWNSGIFIFNLNTITKGFKDFLPEIDRIFIEGTSLYNTSEEKEFIKRAYGQCTNISIDYGIMEKAKNVYVLAADFGWSDLGTWGSLYEQSKKDASGNTIVGANVMSYDTKNCIVNMPKDKLVVIQGVDDLIVVESDTILLICRKGDEQMIRQFVNDVKISKGEKFV